MINFLKNFFDRYFFDDEQFAALFIISIGIIILYFLGGIIGAIITAVAFLLLAAINVNNILVQKIIASVFSFTTVFIYRNFIVFNDDRNN